MSHVRIRALAGAVGIVLAGGLEIAAEEPKPETTIDASKGGYTVKSGDNSLTFNVYAQVRFTVDDKESFDADTTGSGVGEEDGISPSFDVYKVRFGIRGTMFKPWVKYRVTYELGRTGGDSASKFKDVFLEFDKTSWAAFRMGQFKAPFSMQELTGDELQMFTDRAITNVFAVQRDQGAQLSGGTKNRLFNYAVGMFNGSGDAKAQEDKKLLWVGRVWFDPIGEYRLSEGAPEMPEHNMLHFGIAARTGEIQRRGQTGVFEDPNNQTAWNLEAAWKYGRWFATAEYFNETTNVDNPTPGPDVDADGWHVQAGVVAIPRQLEFGARYAVVDPNRAVDDDGKNETRVVVNWYMKGHMLKTQFELGQLRYDAASPDRGTRLTAGSVTDRQLRVQLQISF